MNIFINNQSTMIRPVLRLIAANITPHYYVVDYKKYIHNHTPSYNLIEPIRVNFKLPNGPKIVMAKDLITPKCQDCANFKPRKNVDKTSPEYYNLARCSVFPNKCIDADGARFEYADHCRSDENMCGKNAKLLRGP